MRYTLVVVAACGLLTGCDPVYGVLARTAFKSSGDIDCIANVLRGDPASKNAQYSADTSENYQLLPHRGKVTTVSHVWRYGESGLLYLQIGGEPGAWNFSNGQTTVRKITDEQFAKMKPVIERIDRKVEAACHLPVGNLSVERL